jgi:2-methylisocitrate lyase-like PEP mutase family enzyme
MRHRPCLLPTEIASSLRSSQCQVTRDEALWQAKGIVEAVDLPVSGDLEKCCGDAPEPRRCTVRR